MGFKPVPWAVTGGQASAEIARAVAYAAFQGASGVVGADDMKVVPLDVPGASVVALVGAAAIPCRAPSQAYQSYAARMTSQDVVGVAASSSAGRCDMVVARVEDSSVDATVAAPPAGQEATYQRVFTRVIPDVGAAAIATVAAAEAYLAAQGMSAIPLAGVTMPPNVAAVQGSYIRDLRRVANPRRERRVYTVNPTVNKDVPGAMADWMGSWSVDVPIWATRAVITFGVGGARLDRSSASSSGNAYGTLRAAMGALVTQNVKYDLETSPANSVGRYSLLGGDTLAVPASVRGTSLSLRIQADKSGGNKNLYCDASTFGMVDVEFQQIAG